MQIFPWGCVSGGCWCLFPIAPTEHYVSVELGMDSNQKMSGTPMDYHNLMKVQVIPYQMVTVWMNCPSMGRDRLYKVEDSLVPVMDKILEASKNEISHSDKFYCNKPLETLVLPTKNNNGTLRRLHMDVFITYK